MWKQGSTKPLEIYTITTERCITPVSTDFFTVVLLLVPLPENPELKVYVEDAIRLVLAARPERPLDLIDSYLQRYTSASSTLDVRVLVRRYL